MLITAFLLALAVPQNETDPIRPAVQAETKEEQTAIERCVAAAETPDDKVAPPPSISPGLPPLFSFRFYEGKLHGRFNNSDLMLDDAGH